MKNDENARFPESAELFRFCFYLFQKRFPQQKNNDQELGRSIELAPSDTSHWKAGKRQIKNISDLQKLSEFLEVDQTILEEVATGLMESGEAINLEEFLSEEKEFPIQLKEERSKRSEKLEELSYDLRYQSQILSSPIFLPELLLSFPLVKLETVNTLEHMGKLIKLKHGQYTIKMGKFKNLACGRFVSAREFAKIFVLHEREKYGLLEKSDRLLNYEITDLALALLCPKSLILQELGEQKYNPLKPLATLARQFFIPEVVMRTRLNHLLQRRSLIRETTSLIQTQPVLDSHIKN